MSSDDVIDAAGQSLCPHCRSPLGELPAVGPARCGACRLIVGHGRAVSAGTPRNAGTTSAGAFASFARNAGASPVDPAAVTDGLRQAADRVGVRVRDLRLLQYRQAVHEGFVGPSLAEVLATFRTWSAARDAASSQ